MTMHAFCNQAFQGPRSLWKPMKAGGFHVRPMAQPLGRFVNRPTILSHN
jgi:hypothetical protein